ncbi:MAG: TIGR01212 family radical SAM protein [bacterium]
MTKPQGMKRRYNSYSQYLRKIFGCRVHKVVVHGGFTCPNRDGTLGTGGCIYCNNAAFTPAYCDPSLPISEQVRRGIERLKKRYKAQKFIVYFQPYTNTYAPVERLESLYREALSHEDAVGLAIGTRSDCVEDEKLDLLEELARTHFVTLEYGVESIRDETLRFIRRGHNTQTTLDAISRTKGRGIRICAHIILGFPTETREDILKMADAISHWGIDFLKIHNLQVVRDTPLADIFARKPFPLPSYGEYIDLVCCFLERLSPSIVVERFFAEAPSNLLIAPQWEKRGSEILRDIEAELERRETYQGKLFS